MSVKRKPVNYAQLPVATTLPIKQQQPHSLILVSESCPLPPPTRFQPQSLDPKPLVKDIEIPVKDQLELKALHSSASVETLTELYQKKQTIDLQLQSWKADTEKRQRDVLSTLQTIKDLLGLDRDVRGLVSPSVQSKIPLNIPSSIDIEQANPKQAAEVIALKKTDLKRADDTEKIRRLADGLLTLAQTDRAKLENVVSPDAIGISHLKVNIITDDTHQMTGQCALGQIALAEEQETKHGPTTDECQINATILSAADTAPPNMPLFNAVDSGFEVDLLSIFDSFAL